MSEKQEHRRRFYQKVQYVAAFEKWLQDEPLFFRFIKWHKWKKFRPTMRRDQYDNGYRDGYNAASKRCRDIIIDLYNKIVSDEEYFGSVVARSGSVEARENGCRSIRRKPLKRR